MRELAVTERSDRDQMIIGDNFLSNPHNASREKHSCR